MQKIYTFIKASWHYLQLIDFKNILLKSNAKTNKKRFSFIYCSSFMKKMKILRKAEGEAGNLAADIGEGLLAGILGTIAITLSQTIDIQLSKRKESTTPVDAAGKVLGIQPTREEEKKKFSNLVHWMYGTAWGTAKSILNFAGLKGWKSTIAQFAAVWGTEMVMLPALKVAPPVKEWSSKEIIKDGFHHIVYALVTGLVFDEVHREGKLVHAKA